MSRNAATKKILRVLLSALTLGVSAWCQNVQAPTPDADSGAERMPKAPSASRPPTASSGPLQILTDTRGVDFGPYLKEVIVKIRRNWYSVIPVEAMPPLLKTGEVVIGFKILKNGEVKELQSAKGSGNVALDRAAYAGITASNPFPPLPPDFTGDYLSLRLTFDYNPDTASGSLQNVFSGEQVRLSEILVSTPVCAHCGTPQQVADAHAKCAALLQQIHNGAKFEDVARANPSVAGVVSDGNVGYFSRGSLSKSIEEIVFAMKVGDVSPVIQTEQGCILLKVTDHRGPDDKPLPSTSIQ